MNFRIKLQTSLADFYEPEEIVSYHGHIIALNEDLEDVGEIGRLRLTGVTPFSWTVGN